MQQKGGKTSCAIFLVTAPLLIYALDRYLATKAVDDRLWYAAASGVLLAIGLSGLWPLVTGVAETRGDLIRRSQSGQPLDDGEWILVNGLLRTTGPLLTGPISGTPCVAFFYRMYRRITQPRSFTEELPSYWGYASMPFTVDTPSRSIAVRAAPQLIVPRSPHLGDEATARAIESIRVTSAEVRNPRPVFAGDPVRQWMIGLSADDEGRVRHDWKSGEENDPSTLLLEESLLLPGQEVSVYGPWSARRNAIGDATGGRPVLVTMGPPSSFGLLIGVPSSRKAYWIGALVPLALGAAVIWFALR